MLPFNEYLFSCFGGSCFDICCMDGDMGRTTHENSLFSCDYEQEGMESAEQTHSLKRWRNIQRLFLFCSAILKHWNMDKAVNESMKMPLGILFSELHMDLQLIFLRSKLNWSCIRWLVCVCVWLSWFSSIFYLQSLVVSLRSSTSQQAQWNSRIAMKVTQSSALIHYCKNINWKIITIEQSQHTSSDRSIEFNQIIWIKNHQFYLIIITTPSWLVCC